MRHVNLPKFRTAIILTLMITTIFLLSNDVQARHRLGIGVKVINQVPFVTGSVEWENIKLGVGAFSTTISGVQETYGLVEGKYLFHSRYRELRPYIGATAISISGTSGTTSALASGAGFLGGIAWDPNPFVNIEFGAGFLSFSELTINSTTYLIDVDGMIFEAGITWEF